MTHFQNDPTAVTDNSYWFGVALDLPLFEKMAIFYYHASFYLLVFSSLESLRILLVAQNMGFGFGLGLSSLSLSLYIVEIFIYTSYMLISIIGSMLNTPSTTQCKEKTLN